VRQLRHLLLPSVNSPPADLRAAVDRHRQAVQRLIQVLERL